MNDQPMQQTVNPLHTMEDEELVSRLVLARERGEDERFVELRREVMYRLRCSHIENWRAPLRFPRKSL